MLLNWRFIARRSHLMEVGVASIWVVSTLYPLPTQICEKLVVDVLSLGDYHPGRMDQVPLASSVNLASRTGRYTLLDHHTNSFRCTMQVVLVLTH